MFIRAIRKDRQELTSGNIDNLKRFFTDINPPKNTSTLDINIKTPEEFFKIKKEMQKIDKFLNINFYLSKL